MIIQHLKQIGKVKKFIKWVPCELNENQKKLFWSVVFSYSVQKQWIISWSDCDIQWKVDSIGQLAMTRSVVQLSRSSKVLPIAKLIPKMVMVIVWWSATGQIHYSFLNPSEAITSEKYAQQIDETPWKLQWLQPPLFNRRAQFFSITASDCMSHNQQKLFNKSWTSWVTKFCLICHVLNNFLQAKHFHNQQDAENAFQEFFESQSIDFYTMGINELISCWWKCVACNGSYCN